MDKVILRSEPQPEDTIATAVRTCTPNGLTQPYIASGSMHAPAGMPLGGRRAAEVAISTSAEIISVLHAGARG